MENNPSSQYIHAVSVNHNTSKYMELMLRSIFAKHPAPVDISLTIYDNNSQDNKQDLETFAYNKQIPILPSGFESATKWNSHGEVLRKFVQEHPVCAYYLFLDADICFLEENTLPAMVQELQQDGSAFGIFPRITSNAQTEIGEEFWPIVYNTRLHPCCALVKNTDLFRNVVEEVGFSCINYLWAKGEEYLDTFQMMTKVMTVYGFRAIRSSRMVQHFFCVSYSLEPEQVMEAKASLRDKLLNELREFDQLSFSSR